MTDSQISSQDTARDGKARQARSAGRFKAARPMIECRGVHKYYGDITPCAAST